MISRILQPEIESNLGMQKVGLLLGVRRVGKTALLQTIYEKYKHQCLWLNGEDADVQKVLAILAILLYRSPS
jgi:predicted AAA+ superfamily ATPase